MVFRHVSKISVLKPQKTVQVISDSCLLHHVSCASGLKPAKAIFEDRRSTPSGWVLERGVSRVSERVYSTHAPWKGKRWIKIPYRRNYSLKDSIMKIFGKKNKNTKKKSVVKVEQITVRRRTPMEGPKADMTPMKRKPFVVPKDKDLAANPKDTKKKKKKKHHHGLYDRPMDDEVISFKELCKNLKEPTTCETLKEKICPSAETCVKKPKEFCDQEEIEPDDGLKWHQRPSREFNPCLKPWLMREPSEINPKPKICEPEEEPFDWDNFNPCTPEKRKKRKKKTKDKRLSSLDNICEEMLGKPKKKRNRVRAKPCERSRTCPFKTTDGEHEGDVCVDFLDPWKKYETLDTQKEEKKEKQPPTDKCVDFLDPWKRYKAMAEGKCPSRQCRITITIRKCAKKKSKKPCKKPKKKKKKGCGKKGKKCSSTGSQGSQGTPPPIKCDGNPLPSQGSTASNATTTINGCTLMTTPTTGGIPKINPATLLGYMQSPPEDTPRNLHPPKKLPHLFEEHPNLPLKNPEPYKKPLVAHTPPCYRLPHYCSKSKRITLCDFTPKPSQGTDTSDLAEPYASGSEGKTTKKRMSSWTGSLTTVYETNMKPYKKGTVKSTNDLLSCSGVVYDLTMDEPCKSRFSGGAAKLSPSPNKGLAHKNGNPNSGKVYPRESHKPATNGTSASLLVEATQNVPKPYKSSIPIRPNSRGGERNPKSSGECGKKSISTLSGSSNTPREATHKETPKTLNGETHSLEENPTRVQSGVTPKPTIETPPKIPTKIQTGAIFTHTTLVKVGVYHNPLYTYGYIPKTPAQPSGLVYKRPYSTNPTKTPLKEETTIGKTNTIGSVPQNPILAEGFGDGPKNGGSQINDLPTKNPGGCNHYKTLPRNMSGGICDPTIEPRNDTRVPHPGYFVDNPTTTKLGGFVKSKVTLFDAVFNRFHLNKHGVVVPKYDPPTGYFGNPCYRVGLADTKKIPNGVVTYNPVSHPGDSLMKHLLNSGGLGKTLTFNRVCGDSTCNTRPIKENSLQNYLKVNFGVNPNSSYRHMHGSGRGGSGNDDPTTIEDLLNPEPTNTDKDVILYKITLKNRQKLAKHLMGIELLEPNPTSIVANLQNPIGVVDLSAITNGDLGFSLKKIIETDTFGSNPKSTLIEELKQKLINLETPRANPIKELDYKWNLKGFQDYLHEKIDPNSNAEHKDPLLRIEQKEPLQKEDKVDPTKTTTLEDPLKILEVLAKKRKSKGPCKPKKCPPVCNPPKPCEATNKKKQEEERLKKEKCEGKKPVDCSKKGSKGESKPTCPPPKKECIKRDLDNPPCLCPPKQLHPSQRKPCKKKPKRVCRRLGKKPEPELFECDICKRFQTYEEPKPRMKPTTCVAVKCKKKPSKCTVPIISKKRCLKRGRRQEICVTCPKPKAKVQCQSQPVAIMEEPTKCPQKKCGRKRRKKCVAYKSTQPPPPPPPDPCEEPNNPLREKKAKSKDCSETKKSKKPKKTKKKKKAKKKKKKKKGGKKRRSGKKVCGKSKKCKKPKLDIFDHSKHTDWVAVPIRQGCGGCGEEIPKVIEKSKGDLPKFARDSGFHRVQGGQAAISGPVTQSMRTPRLDKELPKTQTPKKGLAENAQEILRSICDICKKGGKKCAGLLAFVDFSGWNFSVRAHHQELAFSEGGNHDDGNEGNGNGNGSSNYYTEGNYGNDDGNYGNYNGNYDDDDNHQGNREEKNTTIYLST